MNSCIGWSNFTRSLITFNEQVIFINNDQINIDNNKVKLINDIYIMIDTRLYNISTRKFSNLELDFSRTFSFDKKIVSFGNDKIMVYNQDFNLLFTREDIHIPMNINIHKAFCINQSIFYLTDNILFFNGIVRKGGSIINRAIIRFNGEIYNNQFALSKHGLIFLTVKDQKINISTYSFTGIKLIDAVIPRVDNPEEIRLECPINSDYALIKTRDKSFIWSLVFNRLVGFENENGYIINGGWGIESYVFYKNNSICLCSGNSQKVIDIASTSHIYAYPKDSTISGSNIVVN